MTTIGSTSADAGAGLPGVACIIPTHGRPDHLAAALDSVLGQTLAPAEILVVDDLDDAATAAVAEAAALRSLCPLRRVVNRTSAGASGSRNAGAAASRAPLLAFLDDDDAWLPGYLGRALEALAQSGAEAVVTGLARFRQDGRIQHIVMPPLRTIADQRYERNFGMTGSNLVIARAAFERIGGFDPALPVFNDWDFLIRMIDAGIACAVQPEPLVEWREHAGDRISTPTLRRARGIESFIAKHAAAMSPTDRRNLMADALGIRRRNAASPIGRVVLAARLLHLLGLREAVARRFRPDRRRALPAGR